MYRKYAFHDVLSYVLFYAVSMVVAVWSFSYLTFINYHLGTVTDLLERWYVIVAFTCSTILPSFTRMFIRCYTVDAHDISFYYFPTAFSWEKALNNIDARWNDQAHRSEVVNVEVVKLTREELKTKVFYKHLFNKYLKINLNNGESKYAYVGCYSNAQIEELCRICCERK